MCRASRISFHCIRATLAECSFIPNNPLERHSGESRNPVKENSPRCGQNQGVVPLTWGFVNHLDSGLRRNDVVFAIGFSEFIASGPLLIDPDRCRHYRLNKCHSDLTPYPLRFSSTLRLLFYFFINRLSLTQAKKLGLLENKYHISF